MKQYDAIVIGSGIGGLAAALLMQNAGKNVLVIEKLDAPGGRLSSRVKDGFKMDLGVHVISRGNKGPVGQVLEMCGCGQPLSFTSVRPVTTFMGETFRFPQDLAKYASEEDFAALMKFMGFVRSCSEEDSHVYDDIALDDFLARFTTDPIIHQAVSTINAVYVGVHAFMSSTGEFIRNLNWEAQEHASGYPDGGCVAITNAYLKGFKEKGGEIIYHAPVEKVLIEDGKAVGVIADGVEYRADCIVSNAGIKATVLDLVGPEQFESDYVEYVENLIDAYAAMVFRVAMKKKITDLKMFSRFDAEPIEETCQRMVKGDYTGGGGMFLVVPSNFSDKICDADKQLIMVALVLPNNTPEALYEPIQTFVFDYIESMLPEFKENILWVDTTTPVEFEEMLGENGATIGIAQAPGQTGAKRPKIKSPIEGLYYVGGEAGGSGVGIELCVNSALEFFNAYVRS